MSRTYCHTHSAYDCQTCADEILSLGIQVDKDRIKWLESEVARLEACAAELATLRARLEQAEKERDELLALLKEAYGYTTEATDLLPERIKAVIAKIEGEHKP